MRYQLRSLTRRPALFASGPVYQRSLPFHRPFAWFWCSLLAATYTKTQHQGFLLWLKAATMQPEDWRRREAWSIEDGKFDFSCHVSDFLGSVMCGRNRMRQPRQLQPSQLRRKAGVVNCSEKPPPRLHCFYTPGSLERHKRAPGIISPFLRNSYTRNRQPGLQDVGRRR